MNVTTPDQRASLDLRKAWLPGIHYGISWREYASLPYLNASTLCWASVTAQHLKAALDGELAHTDSEDKLFGRALHARLLEPDEYLQRFVVSPGCQAELKTGKNKGLACRNHAKFIVQGQWRCGTHVPKGLIDAGLIVPGIPDSITIDTSDDRLLIVSDEQDERFSRNEQEVLKPEQARRVEQAAAAVVKDKAVGLLRMQGGFEATILWEHEGVKCKSRLDKLCMPTSTTPAMIIDLKKVQRGKATDEHCRKSVYDWMYDVKLEFYRRAVAAATNEEPEAVLVFVEDQLPHGINVMRMDEIDKRVAADRLHSCWSTYFSSMHTNEWHGYMRGQTQVKRGILPDWIRSRHH